VDDSGQLRATHADGMRTPLVAQLAVAGAAIVGLAACGGGASSPGTQPTSAAPSQATVMPGPATRTPNTPSPSASPTSVPAVRPSPSASTPNPGSPGITGWLAGKDWTYFPTTRRVVALTFDAGANADAVPSILATLSREGVPATFF
jgi:hypothetical protein